MPPDDEGIMCERDWENIHDMMARELGVWKLDTKSKSPFIQCASFLVKANTEDALDLIELTFKWIDQEIRQRLIGPIIGQAIDELNHRFREHKIGYQFEGGELIRVDSQFIYAEVVKPALSLLQAKGFGGAEEEFHKAHEHYRHGLFKEAIAEALKAFESTMKAICEARRWSYPANSTAKALLDV